MMTSRILTHCISASAPEDNSYQSSPLTHSRTHIHTHLLFHCCHLCREALMAQQSMQGYDGQPVSLGHVEITGALSNTFITLPSSLFLSPPSALSLFSSFFFWTVLTPGSNRPNQYRVKENEKYNGQPLAVNSSVRPHSMPGHCSEPVDDGRQNAMISYCAKQHPPSPHFHYLKNNHYLCQANVNLLNECM